MTLKRRYMPVDQRGQAYLAQNHPGAAYVDTTPDQAAALLANGLVPTIYIGTTAERPLLDTTEPEACRAFYDTELGKLFRHTGSVWIDPLRPGEAV